MSAKLYTNPPWRSNLAVFEFVTFHFLEKSFLTPPGVIKSKKEIAIINKF